MALGGKISVKRLALSGARFEPLFLLLRSHILDEFSFCAKKRMCVTSAGKCDNNTEKIYGYKSSDVTSSREKDSQGLHHVNLVGLPRELKKGAEIYLKRYPRKVIQKDGIYLSRYLQNRGRATERTTEKLKEYRALMKTQSAGMNEEDQPSNEYKNIVENLETKNQSKHEAKKNNTTYIRYQEREAVAFLASRLQGCYGATYRVLHEIKKREPSFMPKTMLDFGSGLGTATWAAHSLWGNSITEYQSVDISEDMMKLNKFLLRGGEDETLPSQIPAVFFSKFLPYSHKIKYDVVVAAYALSELPTSKQREIAIDTLWRKANDFLVIIEPGNNEGFEIMLKARDHVTKVENPEITESEGNENDKSKSWGEFDLAEESMAGHVFAPCPHDSICARSEVDFRAHPCNFDQKVELSMVQRNTSLKRWSFASERFSYVILKKGEVLNIEERAWPRLLKPVKKRKGHIICECCCSNGNIERHVLSKAKDRSIYKGIRHCSQLGDQVPPSVVRKRPLQVITPPPEPVTVTSVAMDDISAVERQA